MDTRRLVLFVIFSFSIMMLWDAWQQQHAPTVPVHTVPAQQTAQTPTGEMPADSATTTDNANNDGNFKLEKGQRIKVSTDLFEAEIDTIGGDLRHLVLNKHRAVNENDGNYVLMDDAKTPLLYVAQTGLMGAGLPNHKSIFTSTATSYTMVEGAASQEVRLSWVGTGAASGINVDKIYTFHRGSYVIDVRYQINNGSASAIAPSAYYQIVHDNESKQGSKMMPTFTGGAYFTNEVKFKKISFSDMAKKDASDDTKNTALITSKDGWIGLIEHYFAGAWIVKSDVSREFYTKKLAEDIFAVRMVVPAKSIAVGAKAEFDASLFAGPQNHADLAAAAPGLEYAVDYGWLTIVAKPLFWALSQIEKLVHNWGVAIIIVTILLKALFYPLSAKSYRSMAQMRELAPRLQSMKEKFGDDKAAMQKAMMELYKTEKINPMSGCLPILIQIPVFIAFYWMLSGTVELRHAPFFGWIQDLAAPDTLFGIIPKSIPLLGGMPIGLLPILMGATMIIQTFLNPPPTDPVQAQVMKIMPIVFSVFFFFFPAGLVLYWLVNNILSIAQQWYVNKTIHAAALAKKGNAK
jgi:YidC/Oxa1 family membrane protein insertase